MGGKRPDQYRIDRNEGRTTDHKFMPDEPQDADLRERRQSEVLESELRGAQPVAPHSFAPTRPHRRRRPGRGRKAAVLTQEDTEGAKTAPKE